MSPYNRLQTIFFEKLLRHLHSKEIGAASGGIKSDNLHLFAIIGVDWVSPHQVAVASQLGDLHETVYLLDFGQLNSSRITVLTAVETPPWMQKNLLLTMAAKGKVSKRSISA